MNFIAIHIVSYAVAGPLLAEGAPYPYSEEVSEAYRLPILMPQSDTHAGFVFGLGMTIILYFWLRFTPSGFQLDLVGRNARAAAYAGVDQKKTIIRAMLIGGSLAGMAGAIEVIGLKYRLFHLFSDGYGYDGIVVAFLAALNPIVAPLTRAVPCRALCRGGNDATCRRGRQFRHRSGRGARCGFCRRRPRDTANQVKIHSETPGKKPAAAPPNTTPKERGIGYD